LKHQTRKAISKNEYTQIVQDFCSFSRRKKVRIAGYVILSTTQTMGKKTSKLGIFFAGNRLSWLRKGFSTSEYSDIAYHRLLAADCNAFE